MKVVARAKEMHDPEASNRNVNEWQITVIDELKFLAKNNKN